MNVVVFFREHKIVLLIPVIALLALYYFSTKNNTPNIITTNVVYGDVVQDVSVTGRVNSLESVNLGFEIGGRVVSEPRAVGRVVKKGDVLVRLDSKEIAALRSQAKANLEFERANLVSLKNGSRKEDIAVSEAQVKSAESALVEVEKSVVDKMTIAYSTGDDVVHNTADQFFHNSRTKNPELNFSAGDSSLTIDLPSSRVSIEDLLSSWKVEVGNFSTSTMANDIDATEAHLQKIKIFIDALAKAVNTLTPNNALTQTTIDGWKLALSNARVGVNNSITSMLTVHEKFTAQYQALTVAQQQLALKRAPATPESISAAEARVAGALSSISSFDAQISKTELTAPFAGVITRQDAKLGQTVTPNIPVVSMMSTGGWKIEVNVPEVEVAKIRMGNDATITLDAYGPDVSFPAKVMVIDPAETIVEGVATYKVTLYFDTTDDRIRSGMTANITINTATHSHVLVVPLRTLLLRNNEYIAFALEGKNIKEYPVTIGLQGSDGRVEVLGGLQLGQSILATVPK